MLEAQTSEAQEGTYESIPLDLRILPIVKALYTLHEKVLQETNYLKVCRLHNDFYFHYIRLKQSFDYGLRFEPVQQYHDQVMRDIREHAGQLKAAASLKEAQMLGTRMRSQVLGIVPSMELGFSVADIEGIPLV